MNRPKPSNSVSCHHHHGVDRHDDDSPSRCGPRVHHLRDSATENQSGAAVGMVVPLFQSRLWDDAMPPLADFDDDNCFFGAEDNDDEAAHQGDDNCSVSSSHTTTTATEYVGSHLVRVVGDNLKTGGSLHSVRSCSSRHNRRKAARANARATTSSSIFPDAVEGYACSFPNKSSEGGGAPRRYLVTSNDNDESCFCLKEECRPGRLYVTKQQSFSFNDESTAAFDIENDEYSVGLDQQSPFASSTMTLSSDNSSLPPQAAAVTTVGLASSSAAAAGQLARSTSTSSFPSARAAPLGPSSSSLPCISSAGERRQDFEIVRRTISV